MPASGIYGSFIFNTYVRFAPVPKIALGPTFAVQGQASYTAPDATLRILAGDRSVVAESPVLQPVKNGSVYNYSFTFDRQGWPLGNLMQSLSFSDFPWVFINAAAKGQPLTGKQCIIVQAYNLHDEYMRGVRGWEAIYIDPAVEFPRGSVLKAHAATHCKGVHYPLAKWWTEPLGSTGGQQIHREIQIIDDGACKPGEGHYAIAPIEPYTQNGNFEFDVMGQCRDGYNGVGRIGSAWNGFVQRGGDENGAAVFACGSPRIARVNLDGFIETLFGMRLKDPSKPAPYHYKPYRKDWAQGAYEQVGVIVDGDNFALNPWQVQQHPEDPYTIYWNDADQHRFVVYDVKLKKGKTLCGSLTREAGYRDGKALDARFNAPRGQVFRKNRAGKWVLVGADDHGSALRSIDPETGETGTYWKCAGYYDPDGTPHENMNDLALRLTPLSYVVGGKTIMAWGLNARTWWWDAEAKLIRPDHELPAGGTWKPLNTDPDFLISRIRPYIRSGDFNTAVGMHPQALFLMPNNDIGFPQHHPHMVARAHLEEREDGSIDPQQSWIRHLCELPLLLQAGKLEKGWISASGDPDGACGEAGDFAVGYFPMGSNLRYKQDGTKRGTYVDLGASMRWLGSYPGPSANSAHTGYAHAVILGWEGSTWWVPTAGEGPMRMTLQDGSEPKLDAAKFKHGLELIDRTYADDAPRAALRRGYLHSRLGEPDVRHFQGKPAEFRAFIRTWVQARYWNDADVEAVAYCYEWANQHMVRLLDERPTNVRGLTTPPVDTKPPVDDTGDPIPDTHEDDDASGGDSTPPDVPPVEPPSTAAALRAQLLELQAQKSTAEQRMADLRAVIDADQDKAEAASAALAAAHEAIEADQAAIRAATERIAASTAALEQAQASINSANETVAADQAELADEQGALATMLAKIAEVQAALDALTLPPVIVTPPVVDKPPLVVPAPTIAAPAGIVRQAGVDAPLFATDPDGKRPPASITKLWTALLARRLGALDDVVEVNDRHTKSGGSIAGLQSGETLPMLEALYGMLLVSGNDAALALAETIGVKYLKASTPQYGIKAFVARLNTFAGEIGCPNTAFYDPHGNNALFDRHYTTPRDITRALEWAIADATLVEIMSTKKHTFTSNMGRHDWTNFNSALFDYPGTIGGKPGSTPKSGHHFSAAARRGNRTMIACVLQAASDDSAHDDTVAMLDYGFDLTAAATSAQ